MRRSQLPSSADVVRNQTARLEYELAKVLNLPIEGAAPRELAPRTRGEWADLATSKTRWMVVAIVALGLDLAALVAFARMKGWL